MTRRMVNLAAFILFAFYTLSAVMLVITGVGIYRHTRTVSEECDTLRISTSYIENKLRSGDIAGAIRIENRSGTDVLVIKYEGGNECETLVYYLDGYICELFQFTDAEIDLRYGTRLCPADALSVTQNGNLICFAVTGKSGDVYTMTYALNSMKGKEYEPLQKTESNAG